MLEKERWKFGASSNIKLGCNEGAHQAERFILVFEEYMGKEEKKGENERESHKSPEMSVAGVLITQ